MNVTSLDNRTFRIETARFTIESLSISARFLNRVYAFEALDGEYALDARPVRGGAALRFSFTNTSDAPVKVWQLRFDGRWPEKIDACVKFAIGDGIDTYSNMGSPAETVRMVPQGSVDASDLVPFRDVSGLCGVVGAAFTERYFSRYRLRQNGVFGVQQDAERAELAPGETIWSDWLYIGAGSDAFEALDAYTDALAEYSHVTPGDFEMPVGWCSWYYYLYGFDAGDVRENAAFLAENREKLPVKFIQVDDGWYTGFGDWDESEKFGDMKKLADDIRAMGFTPGIWLCPFSASSSSQLAKNHPEYMVQKPNGSGPVSLHNGGGHFLIDPTHPGMEEELRRLYHRLTYDWGYGYIKMDFMTIANLAGAHYDPKATTVWAMRRGLEIIRESVKPGTFILACTCALAPAVGLCDGMRVSCDIFADWDSVKQCFMRTLKRYFYHRKIWYNDADCILARDHRHEDEMCMRLCTRTPDEVRSFVTAMAASGGILMLSDKMRLLDEERLSWLSALFPIAPRAAVPLDYFDADVPGVLDFGDVNGTRIVALINWGDEDTVMTVPAACIDGEKHVFEFWTQENLGKASGAYRIRVPAHAPRILYFEDQARTELKTIIPAE